MTCKQFTTIKQTVQKCNHCTAQAVETNEAQRDDSKFRKYKAQASAKQMKFQTRIDGYILHQDFQEVFNMY